MNYPATNSINPGYVVVEGPIGVGKTSLAMRLAQAFGAEPLLEKPEDNPFLERFYQARKQFALPTQLFFLFQRARQIEPLKQGDMFNNGYVADFLLDKDKLFARANLDDDELRLYEQVYAQMSLNLPVPDLVIYLQAPVEVLIERVRRRGVNYERLIERDYLHSLVDAYTQFFHHYTAAPLLVVNAERINIVDNDKDFQMLLGHIRKVRSGRHFFNPLAASL
ncbi:MAG: deoxynucleoside kinase [Gammaproteobacteria bacterium]|nr:deoxynucleoside kinase [Gammaproteobacteria bacterium]